MLLTVQNNDSFAWKDCSATINQRLFSGFDLHFGSIEPGQSATLEATEFTKHNGERFNPTAYKVQSLSAAT